MSNEFELSPLAEVSQLIKRGISPKYTDLKGIPVINQRCIRDGRIVWENIRLHNDSIKKIPEDRFLEIGDVLVNSTGVGTLGRVSNIDSLPGPTTVDSHVTIVRPDKSQVDYSFFGYAIKSQQYLIESLGQGSTGQTELSREILGKVKIPLPPLPTQERIADILGTLDDKIELNRQMNHTLEAMARAIFKSWFVDFDPVYAKLEGRDSPLPAEVMDLFPDELVESELGLIPKGWEVRRVSDFGKIVTGKTPSTKNPDYYSNENVPFLKIPDMHDQFFITETSNYLSLAGANSQENKYIPARSICVSCIATPGLVVMPALQVQTNQQINSVVPKSDSFSNFLLLALKRKGDEIRIRGAGGSVLRNLNKSDFSNIKVIRPDNLQIKYFNKLISPIFEKLINNQHQNQIISKTRDILLPKLMSGEIGA